MNNNKIHRPNVILINCDDMGYGDLGCYGSKYNDTPTIDSLAEQGLKFSNFYSASPLCSPSRGALMTGCYPPRISFGEFDGDGVLFPGQGIGLNPDEFTLPQLFKNHGYATKMVGKWHCGDQPEFLPTQFGFDEFYGLPYSNDMGMQANTTGRKVRKHPPLPLIKNKEVIEQQPDQRSLTERYVEQSVSFIREKKEVPFFLYLAHMHVHLPLYAAEEFVKKSRNGDFGACMLSVDWATKVIVKELQDLNLLDNTMIIFTSDNGSKNANGASNGPLRGNKGTTWEGGQRVPCIIYMKNYIKPGICDKVASNIDFLPTFASVLGEKETLPNVIDGKDISSCLFQNEDDEEGIFFYYLRNRLEAVRKGDWKLHFCKEDEGMEGLYNLRQDSLEEHNLFDKNPDIVKMLHIIASEKRDAIGDSFTGIKGSQIRNAGRVNNPKPLTEYKEDHPYIVMLYDKEERG